MKHEALFSKKNRKLLTDPLNDNNPVTTQVLGICSALAITVQLKPAIVMAISVLVVMSVANVAVSLMRNLIPSRIRIIVQLVVIAALVILVDQVLKAFVYDVSKELSVFPNPVDNLLTFYNLKIKSSKVQVFSISGELLSTNNFSDFSSNQKIIFSKFSKGIYFLKIIIEKGAITQKII